MPETYQNLRYLGVDLSFRTRIDREEILSILVLPASVDAYGRQQF